MSATENVSVWLRAGADEEPDEIAEATDRLRSELLALDVDAVDPVEGDPAPGDAKGLSVVVGALLVRLGSGTALRAVVDAVRRWASSTSRDVEVTIDGDTLRLTGVSAEQQQKVLDAWLARHGA